MEYICASGLDKMSEAEKEKLSKAIDFAREMHKTQVRASGDPYIIHPIETARILMSYCPDTDCIVAALLHDTVEDCSVHPEQIKKLFGENILHIVEGVTKISNLKFNSKHTEKVENLRKMIMAMATDLRVVFIKLADRLHNMETIEYLRPDKRVRISNDTLNVYAPLANRLGMTRMRCELEDLAMRWVHPLEFHDITNKIRETRERDEQVVKLARERLQKEMEQAGIHAEVLGRTKHIYSIYRKMMRRSLDFNEIYDIIGIRVICDELKHCYDVLGIVHLIWHPMHGMFDDYISVPKENGYQSLHTTVMGPLGSRLEVQIRTHKMNYFAEEGMAAHWKYKEGGRQDEELVEKIAWIRHTVESLTDVKNPNEFMDAFTKDVFADRVFVFTPQGDVFDLPANATPLDFAYYVHTNVGNHCQGAKVNDKIAPLKQTLQNGDKVEILTSNHTRPSRDWLQIAKTPRARNKIRHYLRKCDYDINLKRGHEMLVRALRARGLATDWESIERQMTPHLKILRVKVFKDAISEIGLGTLTTQQVIDNCWPNTKKKQNKTVATTHKRNYVNQGVIVGGLSDAVVKFAGCCSPIPGEDIVGYVTVGKGVTIHTSNCPNIKRLSSKENSRILLATWDLMNPPMRNTQIRIEALVRPRLLSDLVNVFSNENVMISSVNSTTKGSNFYITFNVPVSGTEHLDHLCTQLKQKKGVLSVSRVKKTPTT